jgi:hypothetical protein
MVFRKTALFLSFFIAVGLMGCGSSFNPRLGPISVTDPSGTGQGPLNSVVVSAQVAVSVTVIGDTPGLGVDWNLNCLGSSVATYTTNVCGTLNPVHVGSNINMLYTAPEYLPLGNTVTLTADITSDPSQQSTLTLTILPQPVTIAFTGTQPPQQLGTGATVQMVATVTNDPLAKGVTWKATCGSSACGTVNPVLSASGDPVIYTAPAAVPSGGGVVNVIATAVADATKSVKQEITIEPISVSVTPAALTVGAQGQADLVATVNFDTSNAGVKWEAPVCESAGQCGSIASTGPFTATYTAPKTPPEGKVVTVTAKSVTDPQATASVKITIGKPKPIAVTVTAASQLLQLGGQTMLTAQVYNDFNNKGVTWDCLPGTCFPAASQPGTSPPYQTLYTAPLDAPPGNVLRPEAVSNSDNTKSGSVTIRVAAPISVKITTAPASVTAGVAAAFSATVVNDVGSGGVDWAASNCGQLDCGTFNSGNAKEPNHSADGAKINYTPPVQLPATTVTITATSTASNTVTPVRSASTTTTVIPVPYARFVPFAPSVLPLGNPASPAPVTLIAVAANDTSNQGVQWSVCSSLATCGGFLSNPGTPATLKKAAVPPTYSASLNTASGQAVTYLPPTQMPASGNVTINATARVNPAATTAQLVTISNETTGVTGVAVQGTVQAGTLPVSGASVQLFVAGATGYGSAATPVVLNGGSTIVTTASDGSFTIPAGYACPSQGTELYLVAQGGTPSGITGSNAELGLMTALGPCSNLNSTISVVVNEVTTVASIWALAPFTGADTAHIGSSSSNYAAGFANAFATVNNLVDITKGQAYTTTPAGYGTVPNDEINTLADVVDACAASSGGAAGDGSACGNFFEAANVSTACGGVLCPAPTGILPALLEIALYPNSINATPDPGSSLFNLLPTVTTNVPFQPILTAAPLDWSIAVGFTGGGLGGSRQASPQSDGLAIDGAGNVWIANRKISTITELSNLGAPLSPFTTGTTLDSAGGFHGGGLNQPIQIAIDLVGNSWVLNTDSSLTELNYAGVPVKGSPFSGGGTATANGMAIDGSGDIWVTDAGPPGDVAKYAGFNSPLIDGNQPANGSVLSPKGGYVDGIKNPNGAIAVDGAGTVWILNEGNYAAAEVNSTNGAMMPTDFGYLANAQGVPVQPLQSIFSSAAFGNSMVIDSSGSKGTGNVYIPNPSTSNLAQVFELLAGGSTANDGGIGQYFTVGELPPTGTPIALDGADHLWLMTYQDPDNGDPPSLSQLASSGGVLDASLTAPGLVGPNTDNGANSLAIDSSGNAWVLIQSSSSTVTEFIGVASPVTTPLSVAVQTKSLGKKP